MGMKHSWYVAKKSVKMNRCRYCESTENLTVDHKIPKIQGGTDDVKNLQCLCLRCNQMKSGLSDKQVMLLFKWFISTKYFKLAIKKHDNL